MKRIGLIACCVAMALHGEVFTLGQVEVVEKVGGVQKKRHEYHCLRRAKVATRRDKASLGGRLQHAWRLRR